MTAKFAQSFAILFCLALTFPIVAFGQAGGVGVGDLLTQRNAVGGVEIDAAGVLQNRTVSLDSTAVEKLKSHFAESNAMIGEATKLRMISLKGLEAQLVEAANANRQAPLAVRYLAGLQRIEYVIASPEDNDIYLAGPAEGLQVTATGAVVGAASGRPALNLEDLMVAIRSVDNARSGQGVSVSIDPTEEGEKNLRSFWNKLKRSGARFHPDMQAAVEEAMGPQTISLTGVPKDSRFSKVLVAADYKMKRLSMGLEAAPIKNFPSFLAMAKNANASRMNSSPRMWMECGYEPLAKSQDGLVWQIRNNGVKTLTENMRFGADGKAVAIGKPNKLAQKWADMMTDRYDELAAAEPVFHELRNLMDLSVVAAIIRKHRMEEQVGLQLPAIKNETQAISIGGLNTPKQIPSQSSFVHINNSWLVATSGGVAIDSWAAVENNVVDEKLGAVAAQAKAGNGKWWFNVAAK